MADSLRQQPPFEGQVAVVTGGGGGLGAAFSKDLARRGVKVVVNDLGGDPTGIGASHTYADDVVDAIREEGGAAVANYDTVATPEGGAAIVETAMREFGRIDIVISNAGNQRNGRFGELTAVDIQDVYDVHVGGAFNVCQPAYRVMADQGYGRLVLVSSQSGIFGNPFRSNYGSAKGALVGLMNVVAQEAPDGITVNCLFPTAHGSRMGSSALADRPDAAWLAEAAGRGRVLAPYQTPEHVTAMALYLSSPQCTTSQNMYSVVGGRYSRLFVGATHGWVPEGLEAPGFEDVVAHLAEIDDRMEFDVPLSGLDEMDSAIAARERRFGERDCPVH